MKSLSDNLDEMQRRVERKRIVIIVDDNEKELFVLSKLFQKFGCHCDVATSPSMAIEMAGKNKYDLGIFDFVMPGMNGVQCIEEMKRIQPAMRAVLCTGFPQFVEGEDLQRLGILTLIPKPVMIDDLHKLFSEFNL
jgi:DNA-binding NtrC family response regulator